MHRSYGKTTVEPAVRHLKGNISRGTIMTQGFYYFTVFIVFMIVLFSGFMVIVSHAELLKMGGHINILNK